MFTLSYVCSNVKGETKPAFSYGEVQGLKKRGYYIVTPVYTEIVKEPFRRTLEEYRKQNHCIRNEGKRYDPVWNHRRETVAQ